MELIRNERLQIAVAGVALLLTVAIVAYRMIPSGPPALGSVTELMQEATSAADAQVRRQAARDLVQQAHEATPELRQLAAESDDLVVRATAIRGLGKLEDWESVPLLLDAMEDADPLVRGQAGGAMIQIFKADFGFNANDSEKERATAVAEWRRRYELVRDTYRPNDS